MSSSTPSTDGETHGRGMDGSSSSSLAVPRLPDDAIEQILSRLRAKSLCRCKCVSKPWRDLIADRLGCKDLTKTLQGFLYFEVVSGDGDGDGDGDGGGDGDGDGGDDGDADAEGGDLASDRNKMPLHHGNGRFINLLGKHVSLLDPSFIKERPGVEAVGLLDSCNGLLLFGHRRVSDTYDSLGYIVCNPVTEQWVAVPSSGWTPGDPILDEKNVVTFLIFDPSVSSHFELVQFWQDESETDYVQGVHIYSSRTRLWSDRKSALFMIRRGWWDWGGYGTVEEPMQGRAFINGMLHFLIYKPWQSIYEIVTVDGQATESRVIRWPDQRPFPEDVFIGQSQGRLHCISGDSSDPGLSIWVLEDYDTDEWVLKHSVSYSQLFEGMDYVDRFGCIIVGLHTDRNLIFFTRRLDHKLISYDMDSREVRVLWTLTPGQGSHFVTPYVPSFKSL